MEPIGFFCTHTAQTYRHTDTETNAWAQILFYTQVYKSYAFAPLTPTEKSRGVCFLFLVILFVNVTTQLSQVVCLGFLSFVKISDDNYSAIRVVRVLRPLRAIKNVSGMRVIVISLLSSLPYLADVLALFMFLVSIFGIIAVSPTTYPADAPVVDVTQTSDTGDAFALCQSN